MAVYRYATKDLSINSAKAFMHSSQMVPGAPNDEDTAGSKNSQILYLCIGRSRPWENEPIPNVPPDNEQHLSFELHRNFIAAKKVTPSNMCHVAPRYDWVSGTVYAMWRDTDTDMYDRNFYVLTDESNVYKCLYNNKGVESTIQPRGYSTIPFTTSDGYTWKYMYTISLGDSNKFLTQNYIPVRYVKEDDLSVCACSDQQYLTKAACEAGGGIWTCTNESDRQVKVQNAAVNGAIDIVEVNNTGADYQYVSDTNGVVTIAGKYTLKLSDTVPVPASTEDNFYNGSSVYVISGTGAGQLRRIIDYSGESRTLTVNSAFTTTCNTDSRVIISPTCVLIGDGAGAQAYTRVNTETGAISNVNVITVGSGYTRASVRFAANAQHGSGASANAIIAPTGGHGSDPIRELYADKIMLDVQFDGEEGDSTTGAGYIPTGLEFRSISLLADPVLKVDSDNVSVTNEAVANTSNSPDTLRLTAKLQVAYDAAFLNDRLEPNDTITTQFQYDRAVSGELEFVTELYTERQNKEISLANAVLGGNGDVVFTERDPATPADDSFYNVYINNEESYANYKAFTNDSVLMRRGSDQLIGTVEDYVGPEANTFSGTILFTENFEPVTRDAEQLENMKIVLDF